MCTRSLEVNCVPKEVEDEFIEVTDFHLIIYQGPIFRRQRANGLKFLCFYYMGYRRDQ